MVAHSHVSARSVTLSNNEVTARVIVPRNIEVTASVVIELYVSKVVGPVLDRIETTLTLLKSRLGGSNSHTVQSRDDCDSNRGKEEHDYARIRRSEVAPM
jgi:hypothetical protein